MTNQGLAEMAYEEYCFGLYTWLSTKLPMHLKYGDAHKFWGIKELGHVAQFSKDGRRQGPKKQGF